MGNLTEAEKLLSGKYSLGIGVSVDIHSLLKTISELRGCLARDSAVSPWPEKIHLTWTKDQYTEEIEKLAKERDHLREKCEGLERAVDDAFLKGSEVGDNTANKIKAECNADLQRWQSERVDLVAELTKLRARNERLTFNFKELVESCEWYADKGTDQERHHFLAVEARGNFYDLALAGE
jgi:hypothetical protein